MARTEGLHLTRRSLPAADYEINLHNNRDLSVKANKVGSLDMQTDTSGVVESNSVDSSADINGVTNFVISKNDGAAA